MENAKLTLMKTTSFKERIIEKAVTCSSVDSCIKLEGGFGSTREAFLMLFEFVLVLYFIIKLSLYSSQS